MKRLLTWLRALLTRAATAETTYPDTMRETPHNAALGRETTDEDKETKE